MKKYLLIIISTISFNIHSQFQIELLAGMNLDSNYSQLGAEINYNILPNLSLGALGTITPLDANDDYNLLLNAKLKTKKINFVIGVVSGKLDYYDITKCPITNELEPEPYIGIEYKFIKSSDIKIFYNYSNNLNSLGLKIPINSSKKKDKSSDISLLNNQMEFIEEDLKVEKNQEKIIHSKKNYLHAFDKFASKNLIELDKNYRDTINENLQIFGKNQKNEKKIEINKENKSITPIIAIDSSKEYYIIGGSFRIKTNAELKLNKIISSGYDSTYLMQEENGLLRVVLYRFSSKEEAESKMEEIKEKGIDVWILTKD